MSNGPTPSSCRTTELLTPSLRKSPAILQRKLILAACIRNLVRGLVSCFQSQGKLMSPISTRHAAGMSQS